MWAASMSLEWPENSDIIPTSARKCLLLHCHEPKKAPDENAVCQYLESKLLRLSG